MFISAGFAAHELLMAVIIYSIYLVARFSLYARNVSAIVAGLFCLEAGFKKVR